MVLFENKRGFEIYFIVLEIIWEGLSKNERCELPGCNIFREGTLEGIALGPL